MIKMCERTFTKIYCITTFQTLLLLRDQNRALKIKKNINSNGFFSIKHPVNTDKSHSTVVSTLSPFDFTHRAHSRKSFVTRSHTHIIITFSVLPVAQVEWTMERTYINGRSFTIASERQKQKKINNQIHNIRQHRRNPTDLPTK